MKTEPTKQITKRKKILLQSILAILFLVLASPQTIFSQWMNQPVPVNGPDVYDLKFFNENTGIITSQLMNVYRTTNGGDNWVLLGIKINMQQLQKIDSNAIYGCGARYNGNGVIYRSFNRGETWDSVGISGGIYTGISFINRHTGWVSAFAGGPVIYRTTNGGVTLTLQSNQAGYGKVFFLPYKVNGEYIGWASNQDGFWKSTNSGVSWSMISNSSLGDILFINPLIGWQSSGTEYFARTTNGGYNWQLIIMPSTYGVAGNYLKYFKNIDYKYDTIIGSGATRHLGGGIYKGIIWKSTNSGVNWNFQQPDTSYPYNIYKGLDFIDSLKGWSSNIKTTNGGGPIYVTSIFPIGSNQISDYTLKQNYPNPFNSQTIIEFNLKKSSYVTLSVYNLLGQELLKIYDNRFLNPNSYKIDLNMSKAQLSGGIYIYRFTAIDANTNFVFTDSKKLIYLK
jgi:photosystem II stability/assembly factor-like uncharacterized protein